MGSFEQPYESIDTLQVVVNTECTHGTIFFKLLFFKSSCIIIFFSSHSIARQIQKHVALLCELEALSKCVQVGNAQEIDVPALVRIFYYYAGWAQLLESEMPDWKYRGLGMFSL